MKLLKIIGRITKAISVKICGSNINPHPLIIRILNTKKQWSKKIMDLMKYLIFFVKQILIAMNITSVILGLLIRSIKKWDATLSENCEMETNWYVSAPSLVKKINNSDYKGYVKKKINE